MSTSPITREAIASKALEYVNLPWTHGGMAPTGLDSFGLVRSLVRDLCGIPLAPDNRWNPDWNSQSDDKLLDFCKTWLNGTQNPNLGTVVLFDTSGAGRPKTAAVVLNLEWMLMSLWAKPATKVKLNSKFWTPRIHSLWDLPNIQP